MTALAIWREGRPIRSDLAARRLEFGDALLLQGPRARLQTLQDEPDLIVLREPATEGALVPGKGRLALGIMALTLILAASNLVSTPEVMLAGALAMVFFGVLTMDQVYQAIEWRSVFLVAGMLALGLAMTKTGAADLVANTLVAGLGPIGPRALLAGLFLLTMFLTQAISGQAVGAVVAPIAIQSAVQLGLDPRALAMGVALGTSMAFLTPLGHPVNVLVMGAGGYQFRDYFRVGLPLTLLLLVLIVLGLPILWPLTPR